MQRQQQLDWTQQTFDAAASVAQSIMAQVEAFALRLYGSKRRPLIKPFSGLPISLPPNLSRPVPVTPFERTAPLLPTNS